LDRNPCCAAQLSNYAPTCNAKSSWSLSCPLAGLRTSPQYEWLLADLAAVDRSVTPCACCCWVSG
jgi:hypothetical protein